jgi:hypothetical protein
MDHETRCARTDYSVLLDSVAKPRYARAGCAGRDSANAVLWWLAAPMLSDSINERWVAQMTRDVLVALRSAIGRDERYSWTQARERAVRGELLSRYGPPSYAFWGGPETDKQMAQGTSREPSPPYTTYEYEPGRVSMVPAAAALLDPFRAPASAWNLNPPPGGTQATLRGIWWPHEHFALPFPIVQLPEGQTVLLRRDAGALLAFATDLDPAHVGLPAGTPIENAVLLVSHKPGAVERVARAQAVSGGTLIVRGLVPSRPALVGVEYPAISNAGPPAGRTRFGITPPPALTQMRVGDIAISEPINLRAR